MILDKRDIIKNLNKTQSVILDIGCGPNKKKPEYIGIDMLDIEGVDIVGDIYEVLSKFPDNSVDAIYSFHFFEHVENVPKLLFEAERIMKSQGVLNITVPHFSNPYFYSDYTHKSFWGLYSISYLCNDNILTRKVPDYHNKCNLYLTKVEFGFKSSASFPIRYGIKMIIGSIFNLGNWMKEFYEENLCYLFPCYELTYTLTKNENIISN